jgi:integrase/recombinase XerD
MEEKSHRMKLLAGRFEEWLKALHYSPKTRANYSRDVRQFVGWLAENSAASSLAEVTPAELGQYQIALYNQEQSKPGREGRRLSVGSQACRLAAIRKFFTWLLGQQLIVYNPASALALPQRPQQLPRQVLSRHEAQRLLESTPQEKLRDIRDRAILEVFYATGIRRAELIHLELYDLDLETATLTVRQGKGNQDRMVPLTASAKAALVLYLEKSRGAIIKQNTRNPEPTTYNRLFVSSRSGGPLDDSDIVRIVEKAVKRARISKHVTPHTLRHSCATHLLKGKADIRQIQKLLGHRRLSSTEIYTRVEISDLREVLARCHPREKRTRR